MLGHVRTLMEMIRFSHTVFALPFALGSAAMAWNRKVGGFSWLELLGILLCMVFARSAAMAFNRLADCRIDAANPRTAGRHLPAGELTVRTVVAFTVLNALAFVLSTTLFLIARPPNPWPLLLAPAVLVFIAAYSYTKRFTVLAHFWLGTSLMLAPVSAWIAILGMEGLEVPLALGLAVLFWVAGFDILYACQDAEFDRKAKLKSIPARFGVRSSLRIAAGCHAAMIIALGLFYLVASPPLGWVFLVGLASVAILLIYEHWLVRPDDLSRVNQAFFQVNGIISVGLLVVLLIDLSLAKVK